MKVEVLDSKGCPNHELTVVQVGHLFDQSERIDIPVEEVEVMDAAIALN